MKNSKLKNVHGGIFFSDGIHAATERPSSTYQYRHGCCWFHAVTSLDVRLNSQVKMYMVVHFYRVSGWNFVAPCICTVSFKRLTEQPHYFAGGIHPTV